MVLRSAYCVMMSFGDVTINAGRTVATPALPGRKVIDGDCEAVDESEVRHGRRP